jgi:hypothetical protein
LGLPALLNSILTLCCTYHRAYSKEEEHPELRLTAEISLTPALRSGRIIATGSPCPDLGSCSHVASSRFRVDDGVLGAWRRSHPKFRIGDDTPRILLAVGRVSLTSGHRIPPIKWESRTEGPVCVVGPSDFSVNSGRLNCGGFGFAELREDAELLHKA